MDLISNKQIERQVLFAEACDKADFRGRGQIEQQMMSQAISRLIDAGLVKGKVSPFKLSDNQKRFLSFLEDSPKLFSVHNSGKGLILDRYPYDFQTCTLNGTKTLRSLFTKNLIDWDGNNGISLSRQGRLYV